MSQYLIIKGKISGLETFDSEIDFVRGKQQWLAGVPSIGQAILGNAAAAANTMMFSGDTSLPVQYFRCYVGVVPVYGCFSRAFFMNNDEVEVVADFQDDGSYYAYAVRRLIDHRIWLYPWATKGSAAVFEYACKSFMWAGLYCFLTSIVFVLFSKLMDFYYGNTDDVMLNSFTNIVLFMLSIGLIGGCGFFIISYRLEGRNRDIAEKIFSTLGYSDPKSINMEKEEIIFLTKDPDAPDFYCDTTTKQYQQIEAALWVHHYREAPSLPPDAIVIET